MPLSPISSKPLAIKDIQSEFDMKMAEINDWTQKEIASGEMYKKIIFTTKEFITTELEFVANMKNMNNMLAVISETPGLSNDEIQLVAQYHGIISRLIHAYAIVDTNCPVLSSDQTTVEQAVRNLRGKYTSQEFSEVLRYQSLLINLDQGLLKVYANHKQSLDANPQFAEATGESALAAQQSGNMQAARRGLNLFTLMPMQNITKLPLLADALKKALLGLQSPTDSHQELIELTQKNHRDLAGLVGHINELQRAKDLPLLAEKQYHALSARNYTPEKKQRLMLRHMLEAGLATIQSENRPEFHKYTETYLENALLLNYPDIFSPHPVRGFKINDIKKAPVIFAALGSHVSPGEGFRLMPGKLNAEHLDSLYAADKNHLWLVLKSIKPVSEDFSATQKVQAYIDLANAFKQGKIGKSGAALEAHKLAMAAYEVAQQHPEASDLALRSFKPNTGKKNIGDWIASELPNKTKPEKRESKIKIDSLSNIKTKSEDHDDAYSVVIATDIEHSGFSTPRSESSFSSDNLAQEFETQWQMAADSEPETPTEKELLVAQSKNHQLEQQLSDARQATTTANSKCQQLSDELEKLKLEKEVTATHLASALADNKNLLSEVQQAGKQIGLKNQQIEQLQNTLKQKDELEQQKSDLLKVVVKLAIRNNPEQQAELIEQIHHSQNKEDLLQVEKHIGSLKKISEIVVEVITELKERHGVFASSAYKKVDAIEGSFARLSIDDKVRLCSLTDKTLSEATKEKDTEVGKFLREINKHRTAFSSGETSSFKKFKQSIRELNSRPGHEEAKQTDPGIRGLGK